jgi:hypothetical protein
VRIHPRDHAPQGPIARAAKVGKYLFMLFALSTKPFALWAKIACDQLSQFWQEISISSQDAKCSENKNFISSPDWMTRISSFAAMFPLMIARQLRLTVAVPVAQGPPFLGGAGVGIPCRA